MLDRYTKTVLTVIAAALVVIAFGQLTPKAQAQGAGCGMTRDTACWVKSLY